MLGGLDKRYKDKRISRAMVVINGGQYKGLKARVIFADEQFVKLEVFSSLKKIELPRKLVTEIREPTKPLMAKDMLCAPLSFDAAMNQDMPLDEEGGLNTPRNETTADRDWDDEAIDNRGSMMMNDAW